MQIMEGDIIRTIGPRPYFAYCHTAGNPGRAELDETQELNYSAIFGAIAATGYTGWAAHAFTPRGDPIAALKQAFQLAAV